MEVAMRDGLVDAETSVPTFTSAGLERRAVAIERIVASSAEYLAALLDARPEMQVLVLSEADWPAKGRAPLFGLPNAADGTLIVAGVEAGWWSELAAMADTERQPELAAVYGGPDGSLHLADFFDLVAVHEVAHLFCERTVVFPRLWLGELFANLALHAWVAERAPGSLETLTVLPRLAALGSSHAFEHRTRNAFEREYTSMGGPNYVWYQFRMQVAAAELFDALGAVAVQRLFDAFRIEGGTEADFMSFDESIDDASLAAHLSAAVDPKLGAFSLAF